MSPGHSTRSKRLPHRSCCAEGAAESLFISPPTFRVRIKQDEDGRSAFLPLFGLCCRSFRSALKILPRLFQRTSPLPSLVSVKCFRMLGIARSSPATGLLPGDGVRFARTFFRSRAFRLSFAVGAADRARSAHGFSIARQLRPCSPGTAASTGDRHILERGRLRYLARPVKLTPRTAERLPEVSDNGATYLCRIRKGIVFAADPAFKGKPRELIAADYAYSLKRLLDPSLRSPWTWLVEGKLIGGDELQAHLAA